MKRPLFWTATVLLVLLSIGAVLALVLPNIKPFHSLLSPSQEAALRRLSESKKLDSSVNILLLGTDVVPTKNCTEQGFCPPSNSLDGRSDTILLIHFAPDLGKVNVISVPRDSRVLIEGYGHHKINEANINGGAVLAAQTVSSLLGDTAIDHYVRINPLGVIDLINSVGGVRVYLKRPIRYSDDSQHLYIDLPQGWQTLNGVQAQGYLRFRHDELGDIGRVQRQQEVLKALATKVLSPDTLSRLPEIFEVIKRNVDTDLSLSDLLSLARFGLTLDRDRDLQLVMLPGRFSSPGEFSSSFWVPDTEKIQVLCARYLGIGEVADIPSEDLSQVRVAVQNATGEKLNRRQLLRYLRSKGFVTIDLLRDYPDPLWHSEIIPQQGDIPLAEAAQKALGVGDIRRDSTGQINSDITLRLGKDWAVTEGKSLQPTNVSP